MRVLDASAILRGDLDFSREMFLITPSVLDEVVSPLPSFALDAAVSKGSVKMVVPKKKSVDAVRKVAFETGDLDTLSEADLESLALAFEKNAVLETDDYGIQNVAKKLGIQYEGRVQEGISKQIRWVKRCAGCGKTFPQGPEKTCGVCGSELRKKKSE